MTQDRPKPRYKLDDRVRTPEGLGGSINGDPAWDPDEEDYSYEVQWDDGQSDVQPESFFDIAGGGVA